jgi:hypothetical protein
MQSPHASSAGALLPTRPVRTPSESDGAARELAAQFESLLLRAILAPLSTSLGFYGDAVAADAARTIARGERGGLTDALARAVADCDP